MKRVLKAGLVAAPVLLVASAARADWLSDMSGAFEGALSSGSWGLALGMVYAAGLLTSLTPCVYPMIAITVSVFGASEAKSKAHAAGLSTMYVLGIAVLFTGLGVGVSMLDLQTAALYGNIWFWLVMAALLFGLSLAMFGAFELQLPSSWRNKLAQAGGVGPKGAFVLGMAGGLIATPCTGPVLAGLLIWIGSTGNVLFGALALFIFALGLGTLTWVVGTFAVALPKSGKWMESVKSVLGLVLVGCALFFVLVNAFDLTHVLVERTLPYLLGGLATLVVGLGIGAVHLSYHGATKRVAARKTLGLTMASVGGVAIVMWLNAVPPGAEIEWMDSYEEARELARRESRPLLVDFGASWCQACQELDRNTFADPRVVAEGERWVPVRVDLSPGPNAAAGRALLARYNQPGLPLVVMHDSRGEEADRVTGFIEADEMLSRLRAVR